MSNEFLGALTEQFLERLANLVADRVVQKLRAANDDMIGQEQSPLGRRRHCAAVQRRVAAGLAGAAIVGRRHLLTQAALNEELSRPGRTAKESATPKEEPNIADELSAAIAQVKESTTHQATNVPKGSRQPESLR